MRLENFYLFFFIFPKPQLFDPPLGLNALILDHLDPCLVNGQLGLNGSRGYHLVFPCYCNPGINVFLIEITGGNPVAVFYPYRILLRNIAEPEYLKKRSCVIMRGFAGCCL